MLAVILSDCLKVTRAVLKPTISAKSACRPQERLHSPQPLLKGGSNFTPTPRQLIS